MDYIDPMYKEFNQLTDDVPLGSEPDVGNTAVTDEGYFHGIHVVPWGHWSGYPRSTKVSSVCSLIISLWTDFYLKYLDLSYYQSFE